MKKKKELDIEVLRTFRKMKEQRALPSPAQRLRALRRQLIVSGYKGGLDLSSLIEACGAQYVEEKKAYDLSLQYCLGGWYANYTDEHDCPTPVLDNGVGPTPEEAVGRLLLALILKE